MFSPYPGMVWDLGKFKGCVSPLLSKCYVSQLLQGPKGKVWAREFQILSGRADFPVVEIQWPNPNKYHLPWRF